MDGIVCAGTDNGIGISRVDNGVSLYFGNIVSDNGKWQIRFLLAGLRYIAKQSGIKSPFFSSIQAVFIIADQSLQGKFG